jgi:hypothetical protein
MAGGTPKAPLEELPARSFPNAGDADRIRRTFAEDIGVDRLGVGAHRKDEAIHFSFPIVVMAGVKHRNRNDETRGEPMVGFEPTTPALRMGRTCLSLWMAISGHG